MRVGLALLSVAFAAGLLVQAVLFPPYRAPDEAMHIDMSRYAAERMAGEGLLYPPDDERWVRTSVLEAAELAGRGPPVPRAAGDAPPRDGRPAFADLDEEHSGIRNAATQHPPAYYALTGAISRLLEAGEPPPYDRHVVLLRLVGALLLVPLPLLCAAAARRIGATALGAGLAALVPLGIPMLGHIGASVNTDALLIALLAAMTPALLLAARGVATWPHTLLVGGLGGLALLTKGFALVVLPWIAVAHAVGTWRSRRAVVLWQGGAAGLLATGVGGWWWIRNVVQVGTVQPHHAAHPTAPADFAPDWAWWAPFALHRFVRRFWVEPQTFADPPLWELLPTLALLALVVLGARAAGRAGHLAVVAVALFPLVAMTVLVFSGAAALYLDTGSPLGIHGRYVFPGLVGLAAVLGLALRSVRPPGVRGLLVAVALGAAMLQAVAWRAALLTYWGVEGGGIGPAVEGLLAWSPLPPGAVAGAMALHWAALPLGVVALLGEQDAGRLPADHADAFIDVNPT